MKTLWVDNDKDKLANYAGFLRDHGFEIEFAVTAKDAIDILSERSFEVVLMDVAIPDHEFFYPTEYTKGGHETGIELSRQIKKMWPKTKIVGCSSTGTPEARKWFINNCAGYIDFNEIRYTGVFVRYIKNIISGSREYKTFIVHGHDNALLDELKKFVIKELRLPTPIILRDTPSQGMTIIEKFEEYSRDIDIVFVLLTPDDIVVGKDADQRRARQNVIFEMGFFYGKLQRTSGKVILLHKGDLELPSDINGVVHIKVDDSIWEVSDTIKNELEQTLPAI